MNLNEVAPPGFGHTKGDKKKGVKKGGTAAAFDKARKEGRFKGSKSDMFAIMWSQKKKGDKPHYKPGTDKKYKKYEEDAKYEKLKKKIGSKEKHMKPAICEGEYGKLKGWEKGILQSGLKVRSGLSYDKEMARLVKMYPGFKVEGVNRFDKLTKAIKQSDVKKDKEVKLMKIAGKVRNIPEKKEMTYQEAIDAGWEMTGEGIWWPPQETETVTEKLTFPKFRKKVEERKPKKAQDAGAKARRKLKRKEHAKYVSGSEDNVPDDIRD